MTNERPASWRMPTEKQMERIMREAERAARQVEQDDEGWWRSVLEDSRAAGVPWLPIEQRRLSEVPRPVLRVECLRCFRTVEIQKADAVRLYGPHAVWKDVGAKLLENGCPARTGSREDGCWPSW